MRKLFQTTQLYRAISARGGELFSQAVLAIFPDAVYLKTYLKECAKRFFGAEEGSRTCDLIEKEIFSDLLLFPSDKKYTVEVCSKILEESMLLPIESDKKLIVLSDFHLAPAMVQNKLLKLLEEPPKGVCFLLGATSTQSILPTVLSRVNKIAELPFSEEDIFEALSRNYAEDGATLRKAASAGGGCYSAAEHFVSGGGEQFRLAERFLTNLDFDACEAAGKSKAPEEIISAMRAILKDCYFLKKGAQKYAMGLENKTLCENLPAGVILFALGKLDKIERDLNFNANFTNCLLALALNIKEETDKWKRLS